MLTSSFDGIKFGARIKGLDVANIAEVVSFSHFGADALDLVFRVGGKVTEWLVSRGEETNFQFISGGRAYPFDADAGLLEEAN